MLYKTALSITVDKIINFYYSTVLAGVYFFKNKTKQVGKNNIFGTSVHTITIDQNDNIFINKNEVHFFQFYEEFAVPPAAK